MALNFLSDSVSEVRQTSPQTEGTHLQVLGAWEAEVYRSRLLNGGEYPVAVGEVVLFSGTLPVGPETPIYGEGSQMLSQYGGSPDSPQVLGLYTDRDHCRLRQTEGARTVYSLLVLSPSGEEHVLLAFASCHRFSGEFRLFPDSRFEVTLDAEGRVLGPGAEWQLEEFVALTGRSREDLLARLAGHLARNHPPLVHPSIPTGWCSWYRYYADVAERDILDNLDGIDRLGLDLRYIQIDDGYQAAMGDWLESGERFPRGVASVAREIRDRGFEPAIWIAPFIAERHSRIFREHPEWFVRGADGLPLASDKVSFGGWRRGPWYALDGTHPEVQSHLEHVFRVMREKWGCTYFKLDANFWGALHGGRFHDPEATRIQAYRRGMGAILDGAGDAFVLGCNAPMWSSLGLCQGMPVTDDIRRSWDSFTTVARQLLYRNWQNGPLWINDPDSVVLQDIPGQHATQEEYLFHATAIYASGGMVLSGDAVTELSPDNSALLQKLLPPSRIPARFDDPESGIGLIVTKDSLVVCLLNPDDEPRAVEIPLPRLSRVVDHWTGADLGVHEGVLRIGHCNPRSGRVLHCPSAGAP